MKESAFHRSVIGKLDVLTHAQSMTYAATVAPGTPDYYVDRTSDLWVEFKVLDKDNHLPAMIPEKALPSTLQDKWMTRRFEAGGNVCCIVGTKIGSRIFGFVLSDPVLWRGRQPRAWYEGKLMPAVDLAAYIEGRVK